jgi:RHS repeat-associated protein
VNRTTRFQYRDPAYDPWERSFKGFRRVRTLQPSGEVEQTWFWFGDCARGVLVSDTSGALISDNCMRGSDEWVDKGLMGVTVRVDRFIPATATNVQGGWLSTTTMRYERHSQYIIPAGATPDRNVTFSPVGETDVFIYDTALNVIPADATDHPTNRQAVPTQGGVEVLVRSTTDYDQAGNIQAVTSHGRIARNGTPIDPTVRSETLPVRGRCHQDWACLPTASKVIEKRPDERDDTLLRHAEFGYNGTGDLVDVWSHLGYPRSEPAALSRNLTFGTTAPSTASTLPGKKHLRTFVVDEFGNVTAMRGHSTTAQPCSQVAFDPAFKQFPEATTAFAGTACTGAAMTTRRTFDRGFGVLRSKVYPNATMETVEYDPFGRLSALYAPAPDGGPFATELAGSITYHTQSPTPWLEVRTRVDVDDFLTSIEVFNGIGEHVLGFDQADEVADGARWVLRDWTERDGNGLVRGVLRPWFFSGDPYTVANTAPAQTPAGTRLTIYYDPFGRTLLSYDGSLPTAQYTYQPLTLTVRDAEQLKAVGPYAGLASVAKRDGHGRTIESQTPAGDDVRTTRVTYLGTGEPIEIQRSSRTDPGTYVRTMQWDTFGRMVHNYEPNTLGSDPGGRRGWHYVYDDESRLVGTSDARGCGKNLAYDALARLVSEDYSPCRPEPEQPAYTRPDPLTGEGTEAFYRYDTYEAGQVTPSPAFADAEPLAIGRLVSIQDRGAHTRLSYDGRGRTRRISKRIVRPDAPAAAAGAERYAQHWFHQELHFDLGDRLRMRTTGLEGDAFAVGGASAETRQYSARGAPREIGSSYGRLVSALAYSANGQPLSARYGDRAHTRTAMSYDSRERLRTSRTWRGSAPPLWTDPPPPGYTRPDIATTQLTLVDLTFSYDDVGNLKRIDDSSTEFWPDGAKPVSRSFAYDAAYRLKHVEYDHNDDAHEPVFRPEGPVGNRRPIAELLGERRLKGQLYAYDWQGNVISAEDNEQMRFDRSLGPILNGTGMDGQKHGPNQLIDADGIHAAYDDAGHLTDLTVARPSCWSEMPQCSHRFRYDWDETGHLVRARRWDYAPGDVPAFDPTAAAIWDLTYAYGNGGRSLTSTTDQEGVVRHTLDVFETLCIARTTYDPATTNYRVLPENQVGFVGGVGRVFYDGAQRLPSAGATPLHLYFSIGDHLGSSAFVIDKDSGEVVERTTYQAYGATEADFRPDRWGAFREDFKFTGKEEDIEVGVTYFGARYYHARLGRWMSADPLAVHTLGGDLNPYAYVSGRVMTHIDLFGLNACGSATNICEVVVQGPPRGSAEIQEVVVHGPPRGSAEIQAELAHDRAQARAEMANQKTSLTQTVKKLDIKHIPLPLTQKAYITPSGVRKAFANAALDLLDPLHYRELLGIFMGEKPLAFPVGEDENDYSNIVGAVEFMAATALLSKVPKVPIGGRVSGTLITDKGVIFELTSGAKGGPPPLPFPGRNWTIFKHVEAHAAQIMRLGDISEAVLDITKAPCAWRAGCAASLETMLPEGARLHVYGPNNYYKLFIGTPDPVYP